jgi:hypothetical protein
MMTAEQRLVVWAREQVGRPFAWGQTDCALIALEAVGVWTDTNQAGRYAGRWGSDVEALTHFAVELPSDVLRGLGYAEIPASHAAIGDILTVPADPWPEQLHVVVGRLCLCADPVQGVHLLPTRAFTTRPGARAWRLV